MAIALLHYVAFALLAIGGGALIARRMVGRRAAVLTGVLLTLFFVVLFWLLYALVLSRVGELG